MIRKQTNFHICLAAGMSLTLAAGLHSGGSPMEAMNYLSSPKGNSYVFDISQKETDSESVDRKPVSFDGLFAGASFMDKLPVYPKSGREKAAVTPKNGQEVAAATPKNDKKATAAAQENDQEAAAVAQSEIQPEVVQQPLNPFGTIAITEADYTALEKIVQAEAGGEEETGKILVAQVVLNRVLDENFGDTPYEVIFEKIGGSAQFSPTVDGRYDTVTVTEESKIAVQKAITGEDFSQGALYFSARNKANPNDMHWFDRNLKWLFQCGGHEFYTLP